MSTPASISEPRTYRARRPVWVRPAVVVLFAALFALGTAGLLSTAVALTTTLSITQSEHHGQAIAAILLWLVVGVVLVLACFERSRLVALAMALAIAAVVLFATPSVRTETLLFRQVGLQSCLLVCATSTILAMSWQERLRSETYWRLRSVRRLECPFCAYSLVSAASGRCPECGGPIAQSLARIQRRGRPRPVA